MDKSPLRGPREAQVPLAAPPAAALCSAADFRALQLISVLCEPSSAPASPWPLWGRGVITPASS